MCDAFRENVQWQFMTGGNWVSHPGGDGVEYMVNIKNSSSPLVEGIQDFRVTSEQYYLHVDPAVEVLATTRFPNPSITWFHSSNREVDIPVVWTKRWGHGRVFYNSLGHHADIFDIPEALELMRRGFVWAAEGKDFAIKHGLDSSTFKSEKKMF
jgi:type 1 glutamine amidotransferase